jgi:hypothetical protein
MSQQAFKENRAENLKYEKIPHPGCLVTMVITYVLQSVVRRSLTQRMRSLSGAVLGP